MPWASEATTGAPSENLGGQLVSLCRTECGELSSGNATSILEERENELREDSDPWNGLRRVPPGCHLGQVRVQGCRGGHQKRGRSRNQFWKPTNQGEGNRGNFQRTRGPKEPRRLRRRRGWRCLRDFRSDAP